MLPDEPDSDVLRAAAITASWFGAQARYRGTRFSLHDNELPAGHAIVLSTDANPVSGLGAEKGSHLSVIDNPADPFYKLLVLHGADGADPGARRPLPDPAQRGAERPPSAGGGRGQPAPRRQRLAALGLHRDAGWNWAAWCPAISCVPGASIPASSMWGFRASPDLFLWPGETVPLRVRYRFAEGPWLDNERSRLDVALNGQFLKSLPAAPAGLVGQHQAGAGRRRQRPAGGGDSGAAGSDPRREPADLLFQSALHPWRTNATRCCPVMWSIRCSPARRWT